MRKTPPTPTMNFTPGEIHVQDIIPVSFFIVKHGLGEQFLPISFQYFERKTHASTENEANSL